MTSSEKSNHASLAKSQAVDYVASGVKLILNTVPFAGSLLAEIAGTAIPKQRMDRIADFAIQLDKKINCLEEGMVRAVFSEVEFNALLEEALTQTAKATTAERRAFLASIVANSISESEISHIDSKFVLKLFGEINDIEVIWLSHFLDPEFMSGKSYYEKHSEILAPRRVSLSASQGELTRFAIQESYKKHLFDLGLLKRTLERGLKSDEEPKRDKYTGEFLFKYSASTLGKHLLRTIDLVRDECK